MYLCNVLLMMDGEYFLLDAQCRTHLGEGARNQTKPPLLVTHCPQYFLIPLCSPPVVHMFAKFNLLLAIPVRQSWSYPLSILQKSGFDLSQLYIVWEQHQSPVDFATLAYDLEQFPPLSFCKACVTASCIMLCLAK